MEHEQDHPGQMPEQERLIRSRHGQDLTPSMLQAEKDRKALAEQPTTLPEVERKPWTATAEKIDATREGDQAMHDRLQQSLDAQRQGAFDQQVTQRDAIIKRHSKDGDDVRDAPNPGVDEQQLAYNSDLYPYKGRYRADVEPAEPHPPETEPEQPEPRERADFER
jgi:hypothetical protein